MQIKSTSNNVFQSFYNNRKYIEEQTKKFPVNNQYLNSNKENKKPNKALIAGAALACSLVPVLISNAKKGRAKECIDVFKNTASTFKDKAKSAFKMVEIEEFHEIIGATAGAIVAGTALGAALEKDEANKKAKVKEGAFEFLNCMMPTVIAAGINNISKKTGKLNSPLGKAATIAGSVASGMFIANKTSNKLNEKVFDKDSEEKTKRKFKLTDCLVHADDILNLLVVTKVPFAKSIHLDKILPLIYAHAGYEAGTAEKETK